jgi:endonuclease III
MTKASISQKEKDVNGGEIKKILFQEESVEPEGYINYLLGEVQKRILENELYREQRENLIERAKRIMDMVKPLAPLPLIAPCAARIAYAC